jgi:tetratricopeptide (TPR) repeat protein
VRHCWFLLFFFAIPREAEADDATAKARGLFQQAEVHFGVGEFEAALKLYKDAYRAKQLPAFLFNIGQCHRHLSRYPKALFFYRQYLERATDDTYKAEAKRLIKVCERELEKRPPASKPVQPPQSDPAAQPAATSQPVAEVSKERPTRRKLSPVWFYSTLGLAGALFVTGTVTGVAALDRSEEYQDPHTSLAKRRDLKDSGETLRNVSTATIVAGAVAAGGAAVLFFFTSWRPESESALSAAPIPGGVQVVLGGRF